ncbi:hypothetical protein CSW98_01470 [Vibrio sp. HA2012]|uniref:hypothetical protein n=1 Tax=Vibrio sp. HA2012 TaxID=1971595 RepID=UPI000C2BCB5D|nr:hypothetical protein [Vibrio sp. HA2012]PJC87822.1 hypothetical protein CSW98_01470 [Vibrio sp. HA2012]
MNDHLSDKITAWFVYLISACGAWLSTMSVEWWQFLSSLVLGIIMLVINYRHKKAIEKIAREQGVNFDQ